MVLEPVATGAGSAQCRRARCSAARLRSSDVPESHQQIELPRPLVDPVRLLAALGDLGARGASSSSSAGRVAGRLAAGLAEAASDRFEIGQEAVGAGVTLARPGELETLLLQAGHGPGRRAALADDAGGEEQLAHLVASHRIRAPEICQVDGEHGPKQRLVRPAEGPAQILLGA